MIFVPVETAWMAPRWLREKLAATASLNGATCAAISISLVEKQTPLHFCAAAAEYTAA